MSATENTAVKVEPAATTTAVPVPAPAAAPTIQEATAAVSSAAEAATNAVATPAATNTEALAAAAAAAVTAAVVEVPPSEPIGETPAVGRVSLLNEVDGQGKRRFFPRVKHLIGNKEWEEFLTQVLQCIEEAGAPETTAASHKANNSWYKAFDLIYGGVAREYSIPTGKNRYHKFKDKILEVWVALESQAPGENHCRELAMVQYERYKRACSEVNKNVTHSGTSLQVNNSVGSHKAGKMGPGSTPGSAACKMAGGKRSYNTAMGGGASLPFGTSTGLWKNLDEKAVLEGLPADLRSLVHLKQLSKEMAACTANRAARKGIEEHSKKLDGAYLEALTEYLKDGTEGEDKKAKENGEADAVKKEDPASPDVEMTDEGGAAAETTTEASPPESAKANAASPAYDRCLAVAFLYRYASTLHEQRVLAEAYARYTEKCVTFVKDPPETTNGEEVAPGAAPDAAADEATEAAAVAMEETTFAI